MLENLRQKGFTEKFKDTGFLLKNSFTVVGKDTGIIKPTINAVILSIILTTLFFGSLLTFFTNRYVGLGVFVLLFLIFILTPSKFFYYIRQKANQSWIVFNTITGQKINYSEAHRHTKTQKSNLRKISLIEILIKYAESRKSSKGGIGAFLINLFLAALVEIWDLLSHYMIPAVVVEQKPIRELVPQIKSLRNHVPSTLVGVFGIDFAGNVVGMLLFPVYLLILAIGVGIGYLLAPSMPGAILTIGTFSFAWIPPFLALYLVVILGAVVGKIVESIKVIYFTIFYASITHPMSITDDMRDELTHYLVMDHGA